MERSVLKYIDDNNLADRGSRIGIAVSGGPDSMALLYCFHNLHTRGYFDICALHMEHGIRGLSSERDAEFVAEQCRILNIPLYLESADVPKIARRQKKSVETAGRQAREQFFEKIINSGKADRIATAHHSDDNAESVLMHILRGSGLNGLSGIKAKRGFLIRPFLAVNKAEILNYVNKHNIPFRNDETNADNGYTRNFVRNELLKSAKSVFGDVSESLNRLSAHTAADNDFIESEAKRAFDKSVIIKEGGAEADIEKLLTFHKAIAARVLFRTLNELGVDCDVETSHIHALMCIAKSRETGKKVFLLKGLTACVDYGKLLIDCGGAESKSVSYERKSNLENDSRQSETEIDLKGTTTLPNGDILEARMTDGYNKNGGDKFCEYFDLDKLPEKCVLRRIKYENPHTEQRPDRIRPLGASGGKKLNRYYTDKKIPERQRKNIPVLADGDNIIWVIGYGISDDYKVDENTKNTVRLKYLRKE